jgi:hypothetical protein
MAWPLIICVGQSNNVGRATGATGNHPGYRHWRHDFDDAQPAVLSTLATSLGKDVSLGQGLIAGGYPNGIIGTFGKGGTSALLWSPPSGSAWLSFETSFRAFYARVLADHPGIIFEPTIVVHQGENESVEPIGNTEPAQLWASRWIATLDHFMLRVLGKRANVIVNQIPSTLAGGNHVTEIRAQNALLAAHYNGKLIDCTGYAHQVDMIHLSGPGYIALGTDVATKVLEFQTMPTIPTPTLDELVDHQNNVATHTPDANHYLHLYADTACTVPLTAGNSPGYVVPGHANDTALYGTPSGRAVSNLKAFNFTPSGTGLTALGAKLTNNATEGVGDVRWSGALVAAQVWDTAPGPFGAAPGAIVITGLSARWSDYTVHGLLGLMFGGTAFAPLATVYLSHWSADPIGGGAIIGSAVAITQATTWGAAALGKAMNTATVSLATQTSSWMAYHSAAAGGGNLLHAPAKPVGAGAGGTFIAGQLQVTAS